MPASYRAGTYIISSVAGEECRAFIPRPLPPDPPLSLSVEDYDLMEKANRALGRLDGLATLLPDTSLFLYFFVRKEAVLSSQIEGTQSSIADLLLYESAETPGTPLDDVEEVSSYVAALRFGLERLNGGFPLSLRLLREIHQVLLSTGRGSSKSPGEFRRSQNWIGGTHPGNARFIPPPPEKLMDCLSEFEKFLHNDPVRTPVLLKAALSHVQFETIHPFLDGNGRLGRLLIALLLYSEGALSEPILYLSLFFKQNRDAYYDLLQRVRTEGDWESWIRFFLTGVLETAEQSVRTARAILQLFEDDRQRIRALNRQAAAALQVHQYLQNRPLTSIQSAGAALGLTLPTVTTALTNLVKLGIVQEMTGRRRNRLFRYSAYLKILEEGTEPRR